MIVPHLRTQSELMADIRIRLRDPSAARWSSDEIYSAINDCLLTWYGRVSVPHLYELPSGWVAGQSDYTIPIYIRGPIDPQQRRYSNNWLHVSGISSDADTWVDIGGYSLEPDGDGGQRLRLEFSPPAGDARIVWWAPNSQVPLTLPVLDEALTSDATSLTLATAINSVDESGYIKIGKEWIHYAGVTYGASTTTLGGLLRGLNGTAAASHNDASSVYWGIGVHRMDLYGQMYDHATSFLHSLFMTNAAESERANHERLALYNQQKADAYWRRYVPARKTKIRLGYAGVGSAQEDPTSHHYSRTWGTQL